MKQLTKKELGFIEIEICETGFTLWIKESKDGIRHWLLDGSCVEETGVINLGNLNQYKYGIVYDSDNNDLIIKKR
jgi:hypothetical protein